MASVMYLHISMQEEDILEHTNGASVVCLHFSCLCHCVTYSRHTPHNITEHTHALILASTL